MLSVTGSADAMCGDALKLLFKFRGKAYARIGMIIPVLAVATAGCFIYKKFSLQSVTNDLLR